MKRIIFVLFVATFALTSIIYAEKTIVNYPNIDGLEENSFGYGLLKLALEKVDSSYEVKISSNSMNQNRAFIELRAGNLSVVDSGIGEKVESAFDPVYIPIDMGLLGWRIFIINKDLKEDFKNINTLQELKTKQAGQGLGWTDALIIENSGIQVVTAPQMELLIRMVDRKRFDFLPLGTNETHGFLHKFSKNHPDLIVEDSIVLVYPFARLFYVQKGNKKLHDDITLGLEKAYEDGSFKNFVFNHPFFKKGLEKSDLKNRKVISIDNPFLTEKFKEIDPKWWYKVK